MNKVLAVELSTKIHALSIQVQLHLRAVSSRLCEASVDMLGSRYDGSIRSIALHKSVALLAHRHFLEELFLSRLKTVFKLC